MVFPLPTLKRSISKLQARKPPHPNTHSQCVSITIPCSLLLLPIKNGTKKTWNSTVVVPRTEVFALPWCRNWQREAHVDISYNDDYIICAKSVPNQRRHNHGYLHPIGHLSLLGSWHQYESCEVSVRQNKTLYKRLSNMSCKPTSRKTYSPTWVHDAKV